ncbi:MAG: hypothetical protein ACI4JB_02175 [Porcipelethomonas sp.]
MKNHIKRLAAAAAAISVIGTASLSVSAATADDVVAAARGAGFQEEYVQVLQNYLNVSKFTSEQYDIMVDTLYSVGSEMDDIAMQYFGTTIAGMKGAGQSSSGDSDSDDNKDFDDSFLKDLANKMTDDNIVSILDQMVSAGKELGLDVSFEKKSDKNYVLTVKDADGNIQLVTPIGNLVDRTGVQAGELTAVTNESENSDLPALYILAAAALGCTGAAALAKTAKKEEK